MPASPGASPLLLEVDPPLDEDSPLEDSPLEDSPLEELLLDLPPEEEDLPPEEDDALPPLEDAALPLLLLDVVSSSSSSDAAGSEEQPYAERANAHSAAALRDQRTFFMRISGNLLQRLSWGGFITPPSAARKPQEPFFGTDCQRALFAQPAGCSGRWGAMATPRSQRHVPRSGTAAAAADAQPQHESVVGDRCRPLVTEISDDAKSCGRCAPDNASSTPRPSPDGATDLTSHRRDSRRRGLMSKKKSPRAGCTRVSAGEPRKVFRSLVSVVTAASYVTSLAAPAFADVPTLDVSEMGSRFNFSDTSLSAPAAESAAKKNAQSKGRKIPVGANGAFATSVAIQVPPGRLGMQPDLALSYSSSAHQSETDVGAGWDLSIPRISRSVRQGFPKLAPSGSGYVYDPNGVYEGPSGELTDSSDMPTSAAGRGFAPVRDSGNVRYAYVDSTDTWVEYLPNGTQRSYGTSGSLGARVKSEHGTFSWLLYEERDTHGNTVHYEYNYASEANRSDKRIPQRDPVVATISWGANAIKPLPHAFQIRTHLAERDASFSLLKGNVLEAASIDRIDVGSTAATWWSYQLNYEVSPDSQRRLLKSVTRSSPDTDSETTTFSYSTNSGKIGFGDAQSLPSVQKLYSDRWTTADVVPPTQYVQSFQSNNDIIAPIGHASGTKFMDMNGDQLTDAIYHPAGIGSPASWIRWNPYWANVWDGSRFAPLASSLLYSADAKLQDDFRPADVAKDLVDVDGDGDPDGAQFPLAFGVISGPGGGSRAAQTPCSLSTPGSPGALQGLAQICRADTPWADLPEVGRNRLCSLDELQSGACSSAEIQHASCCMLSPLPSVDEERVQRDELTPTEIANPYSRQILRWIANDSLDGPARGYRVEFLNNWPRLTFQAVGAETRGHGGPHPERLPQVLYDFSAPWADVNGDGRSDLVLLKQSGYADALSNIGSIFGPHFALFAPAADQPCLFRMIHVALHSPRYPDWKDWTHSAEGQSIATRLHRTPDDLDQLFNDVVYGGFKKFYAAAWAAGSATGTKFEDVENALMDVWGVETDLMTPAPDPSLTFRAPAPPPTLFEPDNIYGVGGYYGPPRINPAPMHALGAPVAPSFGPSGGGGGGVPGLPTLPTLPMGGLGPFPLDDGFPGFPIPIDLPPSPWSDDGFCGTMWGPRKLRDILDAILQQYGFPNGQYQDPPAMMSTRYVPRVYVAQHGAEGDEHLNERNQLPSDNGAISSFSTSLQQTLNYGSGEPCSNAHGGSAPCRYWTGRNFVTTFIDANADGLPDLLRAVPPGANVEGQMVCHPGFNIDINLGYRWIEESRDVLGMRDSADVALGGVKNRDGTCINNAEQGGGTGEGMHEVAFADVNGDGRVDILRSGMTLTFGDGHWGPDAQYTNAIYLNTGFGFVEYPHSTYDGSHGLPQFTAFGGTIVDDFAMLGGGPRKNWPDLGRMADIDNDGLVDFVEAGYSVANPRYSAIQRAPAWHKNKGTLPDLLVSETTSGGSWTNVTYVPGTDSIVSGQKAPGGLWVAKTIESGVVPQAQGGDSNKLRVALTYSDFTKDGDENETLGFRTVAALFTNRFDNVDEVGLLSTDTYDVAKAGVDGSGVPLAVSYPFKGRLVQTVAISGTRTLTSVYERSAINSGNGVRLFEDKTTSTDSTGNSFRGERGHGEPSRCAWLSDQDHRVQDTSDRGPATDHRLDRSHVRISALYEHMGSRLGQSLSGRRWKSRVRSNTGNEDDACR